MNHKELKHIAPTLAKLREKNLSSGFIAPSDYFSTIDDSILQALFPGNLPKQSGYYTPKNYFDTIENSVFDRIKKNKKVSTLPDNYFETLEDRVFERLTNEKTTKVRSLKKYWIGGLVAVAASLLLFISIYKPQQEQNIDVATLESYLLDNEIDLDTYELAEAINDNELVTIETENTIKQSDLEDYLLEAVSEENLY